MTDLHVDDDAFVRAPAALVYRRLTDIGGWSRWWPGVDATPLPAADGDEAWRVRWRRGRGRALTLDAHPGQWRHHAGFRLELTGDVTGWSEFWLEEGWGGTVVHHLLVASTDARRPARVLADYRAVLRRGLWAMKDELQSSVRTTAGMAP